MKKKVRTCATIITIMLALCAFGAPAQTRWLNPLEAGPNMVHGRWWNDELKDTYHRLTPRAEGKVRSAVWNLSKQAAGLSICFHSNAPSIKVRYKVTGGFSMFHMPSTGVSGLDLYATDADAYLKKMATIFPLSLKPSLRP